MATSATNSGPNPPTAPKSPTDEFMPPAASTPKKSGGMSPMIGAIILVVVMVLAGVGAFIVFNGTGTPTKGSSSGSSSTVTCDPPSANLTVCHPTPTPPVPGASIFAPITSTQAGNPLTFSVTTPAGAPVSSVFVFGDGSNLTSTSSTVTHTYTAPGVYFVSVVANAANGKTYTNTQALTKVTVTQSVLTQLPSQPTLLGSVSGGSTATIPATGSLTLQGIVSAPPSDSAWTVVWTRFVTPTPNLIDVVTSNNNTYGATATVSANASTTTGVYTVNFEVATQSGSLWNYTNFTFSVGYGVTVPAPTPPSPPHKGVLNSYELVPGGSVSEDPAADYETAGTELIYNVYQTLVAYNGSVAGPNLNDYVPDLATCVPGSSYCTALYGSTLQSGDNYTFVINSNAQFYNPVSNTHSAVWPNDVVFSFARTCLFSTFPYGNPGWIQCQALLPAGNPSWDNPNAAVFPWGLHYPYNNTPSNILSAITMNGSACPKSGGSFVEHGCVTFNTQASGHSWPMFLEFLVDGYGGGVISCAWATAEGAGLPGWSCGATTNPTGIAPTAWDSYQLGMGSSGSDYSAASSGPSVNAGLNYMRWNMVGSGPYYLSQFSVGASYQLKANPYWAGTGTVGHPCNWRGCIPTTFNITTVNNVWESSPSTGEIALENGQADLASVPATDFSSVLIPLLQSGKVSLTSATGLSIYFTNFNFQFSQSGAQGLLPAGTTLNAPSTLFQDLAFRQFLIHTYPYQTVQTQFNTIDGIQLAVLYGGAIPKYMGNYYPTNVSWANQDPAQGGASSWWTNVTSESGGIAKTACTTAKPCVFPFASYTGAPLQDQINSLWVSNIIKYSNGAVKPVTSDINFYNLVVNSFSAPGSNPMPMYELGWAPDYPDPTDYVVPMYMPDQTYTYGDAIAEGFSSYSAACTTAGWQWAVQAVTMACQGTAYNEMVSLLSQAAFETNLNLRVLLYNEAEHIAQQLGIFTPNPGQASTNWISASWIAGNTLNTNPTIGGGGDSTFYSINYA